MNGSQPVAWWIARRGPACAERLPRSAIIPLGANPSGGEALDDEESRHEGLLEDLVEGRPESPTPHLDKLNELLKNVKLPPGDQNRIEEAIKRYRVWVDTMNPVLARDDLDPDMKVDSLVAGLNEYRRFVELDLIWDSEDDFLHRQRGQLKIESSIIEEFLIRLAHPAIISSLAKKTHGVGPRRTFSAAYFATTLGAPAKGTGLQVRTKDHDFTVGREAYLRASHSADFPIDDTVTHSIYLAFVAAECKTNLDKTMFQEAAATAHDLKMAIPGARYYLLCEWLDMTPISTAATDIDEVIVLRGKRLPSNVRAKHSTRAGRQASRDENVRYIEDNPIRKDRVLRFVNHMRTLFDESAPKETDVLARGYF